MNNTLTTTRIGMASPARAARLTWAGPLGIMAARSVFAMLAQALVVLIYFWQQNPDPLRASTPWWPVTGTLVDAGCLAILVWLTRREGISLLDLVGLNKKKLLRDVLTGLGCMVVLAPVVMIGGGMLSGLLVYGSIQPALPAEVMTKHLPLWAALYARMVWWVIWSVTEEMIYTGYALPRLQRLTGGRTALAVAIVGFFWAIQHSFLPFIPDVKVFLYLFVQMVPLVTAIQLLYLKFRRLPPLIVMHWGMDLFSTIIMITVI